jgi:hypothetical protein
VARLETFSAVMRSTNESNGTLRQLVQSTMALVAVCRRCKHCRVLFPASLTHRFGEDFPALESRERLGCSKCRGPDGQPARPAKSHLTSIRDRARASLHENLNLSQST